MTAARLLRQAGRDTRTGADRPAAATARSSSLDSASRRPRPPCRAAADHRFARRACTRQATRRRTESRSSRSRPRCDPNDGPRRVARRPGWWSPRGWRTSELKRPLSVPASSASASSTAARRSGGPSSATTSSMPPPLRRPARNLDACQRPALHRLLGRLAEDLVEGDGGVLTDLVGGPTSRSISMSWRDESRRASAPAAEAKPSWWSTRGSRSSQSCRRSRAASRASSRPRAKTSRACPPRRLRGRPEPASSICEIAESCWTGPSWISSATRRRSSCSESMRSARRARSVSSDVNRSSPRGARLRPPACACRLRASRGCAARGSSRSPG